MYNFTSYFACQCWFYNSETIFSLMWWLNLFFLKKNNIEQKREDIHQFFICPIFSWCYNQNVNWTIFSWTFFCLVSQTTDAGSSVKSVSLLLALGLVLAPLILPNTWVNLSLKKVSPSIKVQSKISFPP